MIMKFFFLVMALNSLLYSVERQYIDGVAAIVEERIVLKSDLAQMVNMAIIQNNINPQINPNAFLKLQKDILNSMINQKILLEMAAVDSIQVEEKEVDQAINQQIDLLISQAGGKEKAEEVIGQSISDFRREFWYDMEDRLISEKYQQQLLSSISVSRKEVNGFYKIYKDSIPPIPMKAKLRHILIPVEASNISKEASFNNLDSLKERIESGQSFTEIAIENSQDPGSKSNGGSLGWVTRGSLVKNFETAAFSAKVNTLVGPIESEFGFHLIETLEKKGDKILVRHILDIPEITLKDKEKSYNFALTLSEDSIKTIEDFRLFVDKYSYDKKTRKIGGNLGWIAPDNFNVPEIGEAIKYIDMNKCSPPINSSLGFHLLWIESVKKGGRPNKDDHWPELEEMALNKKKMDWYENWIKDVRRKFYIKELSN